MGYNKPPSHLGNIFTKIKDICPQCNKEDVWLHKDAHLCIDCWYILQDKLHNEMEPIILPKDEENVDAQGWSAKDYGLK